MGDEPHHLSIYNNIKIHLEKECNHIFIHSTKLHTNSIDKGNFVKIDDAVAEEFSSTHINSDTFPVKTKNYLF